MFEVPSLASLNIEVALPAIFLAFWAIVVLVVDLFLPKERRMTTVWLSIAGIVITFVLNLLVYNQHEQAFLGMFVADPFSGFLNIVILLTALMGILLSVDYLKRTGIERGEFYSLLLFTTTGMMFMTGANDLITVFVALELLSIPLYVLSAFRAPDLKSEESGLKYFIMGAYASAFFVFGAAMVYGATGTTSLPEIFNALGNLGQPGGPSLFLMILGAGLIVVGLGFKVAVVPFHMWTPDVYEGAPTPVTAFMSVGAKAGGFAALLRIMIIGLPLLTVNEQTVATWQTTLWLIAAATLILGNLVAILQSNVKRMLAYSSIAHAGYILMAVAAAGTPGMGDQAAQAALVYLMAYMFTNMGAFAIALSIEKDDGTGTNISDFNGLGRSRPLLAAMMALFMLSLTGIPLTSGFMGKWLVFQAAIDAQLIPLAIIGVLTSVISAFYYARIIINMYFGESQGDPAEGSTTYVKWAAYIAFAGTILIGIAPMLVTTLTDRVALAVSMLP
ncbi:MAG: NADH-quinone oxidoreductase subunit N [Chloroflexi bacterium]|nr:NADH-quinone oxidoreductase subunit N [Chloroflexota bacterium]